MADSDATRRTGFELDETGAESGNLRSNYGDVVSEAAPHDAGIALPSRWDILDSLADGSLEPVLGSYKVDPLWSVWAVRPPGKLVPARVRVFTDFVEQKLKMITE